MRIRLLLLFATVFVFSLLYYKTSQLDIKYKDFDEYVTGFPLLKYYCINPIEEYFKEDEFIGFKSTLDSILFVKVWKLGRFNGQNYREAFDFTNQKPKEKNRFFKVTSSNMYDLFGEFYDIKDLPNNSIENFSLFIEGKKLEERINDSLIIYNIAASQVIISTNNTKANQLNLFGKYSKAIFIFYKDNKNDTYLVVIHRYNSLNDLKIEDLKLSNGNG